MHHREPETFFAALPATGRLLALDVGTKTIGLALSDAERQFSGAADTLRRSKFTVEAASLQQLCAQEAVAGLVIGYPLNMDGSEGPRCQATRAFARELEKYIELPMLLWDERMSSQHADALMLEADLSRQKRADKIDRLAAALFLQALLDKMRA